MEDQEKVHSPEDPEAFLMSDMQLRLPSALGHDKGILSFKYVKTKHPHIHILVRSFKSLLLTAESSKAGISIPPPRPKRKPSHPYPRKHNTSSEFDQSGEIETEKEQRSLLTQPSSTPSHMTPPGFQPNRTNANMSLSQILESAAAAAAVAWSQVVATAGPRVQQQLQVGFHCFLKPLLPELL